ncbi:hypothetical protein CROQUDRAFT_661531 [Cronartium quercuum f. sp. fusiforme G11]|uniref:Autophagy-related protein 2 n=1 Tax=Cronartium quercuum f. sp. fusiforme G11 TaxID=708437 RepID=A0A9P6T8L2_9BASI|nr:hypothetical protein CROQUDRAFT_661531 [Cronartium quercuum f. sp. fusiforme G11]
MAPFTLPTIAPTKLQHRLLSYLLKRFLSPFLKDRGVSFDSKINNPLESDAFTINNVELDPTTLQEILSRTSLCLTIQSATLDKFSLRIEWPPWSLSWDKYVPTVNIRLQGIKIVLAVKSENGQDRPSSFESSDTSHRNLDLASSFAGLADDFVRYEDSDTLADEPDHQLPGAFASQSALKEITEEPDRRGIFAGLIEKILEKLSFEFDNFSLQVRHDQADLALVVDRGFTHPDPEEFNRIPRTLSRNFYLSPPTIYFRDLPQEALTRSSTPSNPRSISDESLEVDDDMLMSQAIADLRDPTPLPNIPSYRSDDPPELHLIRPDRIFLRAHGDRVSRRPVHTSLKETDIQASTETTHRLSGSHSTPVGEVEPRHDIMIFISYIFPAPPATKNPTVHDAVGAHVAAQLEAPLNTEPTVKVSHAGISQYQVEIGLPEIDVHIRSPSEIKAWINLFSDMSEDSLLISDPSPVIRTSSDRPDISTGFDFKLHCRRITLRADCDSLINGYVSAYGLGPVSNPTSLIISLGPIILSYDSHVLDVLDHNQLSKCVTRLTVTKIIILAKSPGISGSESHESLILQVPESHSTASAVSLHTSKALTEILFGQAQFDIDLDLFLSFRPLVEALDSSLPHNVESGVRRKTREYEKNRKVDSRSNSRKVTAHKALHTISVIAPSIKLRIRVSSPTSATRNRLDYREKGVALAILLKSVQVDVVSASDIHCTVHSATARLDHSSTEESNISATPFLIVTSALDENPDQPEDTSPCVTINYGGPERTEDHAAPGHTHEIDPAIVNLKLVRILLNKTRFDRLQYWLDDLSSWALRSSSGNGEHGSKVQGLSDVYSQENFNPSRSASLSPVSSVRSVPLRSKPRETTLCVQAIKLTIDLSSNKKYPLSPSPEPKTQLALRLQGLAISQTLNKSAGPQTSADASPDSTLGLRIVSVTGDLKQDDEVLQLVRTEGEGDISSNMEHCALSISIKTTASSATSSTKRITADVLLRNITVHIGPYCAWFHDLFSFIEAPPGAFEVAGPNYLTRVRVTLRSTAIRVSPPSSECSSEPRAQFIIAAVFDDFAVKVQLDPSSSDMSPEIQGTTTLQLAESQNGTFVRVARLSNVDLSTSYSTGTGKLRGRVRGGSFEASLCADSAESLGDVIAALRRMSFTKGQPELELDREHTIDESVVQPKLRASLLQSAMQDTSTRQPPLPFDLGEDLVHEDYPTDAEFVQNGPTRATRRTDTTKLHTSSIIRTLQQGDLNIIDDFLLAPRIRSTRSPRAIETEFKIENFDVSICLHEGYDWTSTRHAIEEAQKAMRKRLQKLRQLLAKGHLTDDAIDDELPSATLFKSVHFGLPASSHSLTTAQLLTAIERELDDHGLTAADDDTSIASSWQTLPSPPKERSGPTINSLSPLRNLQRSRHPALEFTLKNVTTRFRKYDTLQKTSDNESNRTTSLRLNADHVSIIDNIRTSTWKKFLTELRPNDGGVLRPTGAPMLRVNLDMVLSSEDERKQEALLKLKIAPLRLYVDQDAIDFLKAYFAFQKGGSPPEAPIVTKPAESMFFQRVEVFPIRIKLDYKPKRVNYLALQQGKVIELMNFFHFDGSDMTLRHAVLIGVPGPDKIGQLLQDIWTPDIKANQLADVISGIAPVRSVVNVGSGIADLVLLPIEQVRKDGRLARGLQKGTTSFAKSTALEAIKLGAKLATGTQVILERAEAILGARLAEDVRVETIEGTLSTQGGNEDIMDTSKGDNSREMISRYAEQPGNVQMGAKLAYRDLRDNMRTTAQTILAVPLEVFNEGSGRAVVKAVPIAILHPMVGATGAISKTLLGLRHTLDPHASDNDEDKYKRLNTNS